MLPSILECDETRHKKLAFSIQNGLKLAYGNVAFSQIFWRNTPGPWLQVKEEE